VWKSGVRSAISCNIQHQHLHPLPHDGNQKSNACIVVLLVVNGKHKLLMNLLETASMSTRSEPCKSADELAANLVDLTAGML